MPLRRDKIFWRKSINWTDRKPGAKRVVDLPRSPQSVAESCQATLCSELGLTVRAIIKTILPLVHFIAKVEIQYYKTLSEEYNPVGSWRQLSPSYGLASKNDRMDLIKSNRDLRRQVLRLKSRVRGNDDIGNPRLCLD